MADPTIPPAFEVRDNPGLRRYEVTIDGHVAELVYRRHVPGVIELVHTGVPEELRGRGLAQVLAKHALDAARAAGDRVVVKCPFVATYIKRHPEYADLVAQP